MKKENINIDYLKNALKTEFVFDKNYYNNNNKFLEELIKIEEKNANCELKNLFNLNEY